MLEQDDKRRRWYAAERLLEIGAVLFGYFTVVRLPRAKWNRETTVQGCLAYALWGNVGVEQHAPKPVLKPHDLLGHPLLPPVSRQCIRRSRDCQARNTYTATASVRASWPPPPGCIFSMSPVKQTRSMSLRPHAVNLSPMIFRPPSIERASVDVKICSTRKPSNSSGRAREAYIHVPYDNLAHAKGQSVEISHHTNGTSHKTRHGTA